MFGVHLTFSYVVLLNLPPYLIRKLLCEFVEIKLYHHPYNYGIYLKSRYLAFRVPLEPMRI